MKPSSLYPVHPDQDPAAFRSREFREWVCTGRYGHCQPLHGPYGFLGFAQRSRQKMLVFSITRDQNFQYGIFQEGTLLREMDQFRKRPSGGDGQEPWPGRLLDLAAADPAFFSWVHMQPVPDCLKLWEEDGTVILLAQLATPLFEEEGEEDPELDLSDAVFGSMDQEILRFIGKNLPEPDLGEYRYLRRAGSPEVLRERMDALARSRAILHRAFLKIF